MKTNQNGFSVVEVIVVLVVVVLLGTVGWLVYDRQQSKNDNTAVTTQTTQPATTNSDSETNKAEDKTATYTHSELKYSFDHPKEWTIEKVAKPEGFTGVYSKVHIKSANYKEKTDDAYGGVTKGAIVTVTAQTAQGKTPIADYVSGKVLYTSEEKSLTVAGEDAVEYRLAYEGPPSLKTQFYKDDLVYIINYADTTNPDFDKYLDEYRAIVKSFRFN
ncbi:prepilin-type N-terminal cleavage/methylation domain-containing protein [Candidatus Saccharibacteria bacterium]|nr:prepilin-type N-terminal cleavage/methylation domain-containing protein [Candidatus Saccharibacteria bacterium]